jgi:thioesterase domain-containing protein/acyl carrier protein
MTEPFEELNIDELLGEVEAETAVEMLPADADAASIAAWIQRRVAREKDCAPEQVDVEMLMTSLGVSSISALTITGELAEALNRDLPDTLLFDQPTIAAVARYLVSETVGNDDAPVAKQREKALRCGVSAIHFDRLLESNHSWAAPRARPGFLTKTVLEWPETAPFFWVNDYKGSLPLAQALGQTLHALPSGYRLLRHTGEVIRSLAEYYASELAEIVRSGERFGIGGYCFGGKLALEIARVLKMRGLPAHAVVLVECPGPDQTYWKAYRSANRMIDARKRERLMRHARKLITGEAASTLIGLVSRTSQRRKARTASREGPQIPVLEETKRHWEYVPEPFPFPVTRVFASNSRYWIPGFSTYGWPQAGVAGGEIVTLPGDHSTIIEPGDVDAVARMIAERMRG